MKTTFEQTQKAVRETNEALSIYKDLQFQAKKLMNAKIYDFDAVSEVMDKKLPKAKKRYQDLAEKTNKMILQYRND